MKPGATQTASGEKNASQSSEFPWYLDGTLGGAGHAIAIAEAYGGKLNIIGLDQDPVAIERNQNFLAGVTVGRVILNDNLPQDMPYINGLLKK